ncbi:aspartate/glutamate racemase family protein [Campylobacter sp. FMV-PI01]|uniref:Aspartate/glutamate racemase family protein n=1 Tax=Campylobacter portucalensis TaxID=2608384 RepID=A0A6L5WHR9_9BACT|nr:aspartate/glutamate racemase family protein [Campylobacter portucalensis]MSN96788.1 aspartate/glutamate racemase family protein [Campylobacter portucalensis]
MKTIGIIGGMSYESTTIYYNTINQVIKDKLGGLNSAKILLQSVNFAEIEKLQKENKWQESGEILGSIAKKLENAGADFIILATNTMHKVANIIQNFINIEFFHITDATIKALNLKNIKKIGLLGTKYSLKDDFLKDKFKQNGFEVIIPNDDDINLINDIIFKELCVGKISKKSYEIYIKIIENFKSKGVQAIVLGCTEIGLLINEKNSPLPVFDTAIIHAKFSALKSIGEKFE